MKPIKIKEVLDLARQARLAGYAANPLFTGDAGLGKSFICQQWVEEKRKENPDFGFIDLRIAYMEAPDLIGFPDTAEDDNGIVRTMHRLPEFWPTEGEGLLLLEEPNRGTTGVMNCLMQLLTDYKVHNYTLPKGWVVAACINPDSAEYDVSSMDAALKNRFEEYEITYDSNSFITYIEAKDWDEQLVHFIKSGTWVYRDTKQCGLDGHYISPRTMEKVNSYRKVGLGDKKQMHYTTMISVLGKDIGGEFHKFCYDEAPVLYTDLIKNKKAALKKLKEQSSPKSYKGDMIAITVESIIKHYGCQEDDDKKTNKIGEDTMAAVAKVIPSDQAINLIKKCGFLQSKGKIGDFFREFVEKHPSLVDVIKSHIVLERSMKKKK